MGEIGDHDRRCWPDTGLAPAHLTNDSLSDIRSQAVDFYSAVMSEKRQESPGGVGNTETMKSAVLQRITGMHRIFREAQIANPLVLGSSPSRPTSEKQLCRQHAATPRPERDPGDQGQSEPDRTPPSSRPRGSLICCLAADLPVRRPFFACGIAQLGTCNPLVLDGPVECTSGTPMQSAEGNRVGRFGGGILEDRRSVTARSAWAT